MAKLKEKLEEKANNESAFVLNCWTKVAGVIGEIPQNRFVKNKVDGQFFIVLTGYSEEIEIQSLKMYGFERGELLNIIANFFYDN
jgi:hypothetical protein